MITREATATLKPQRTLDIARLLFGDGSELAGADVNPGLRPYFLQNVSTAFIRRRFSVVT